MRIDCLSDVNKIDPNSDNVDIHVTLDDGREHPLTAATPSNIFWRMDNWCMDNEGLDYFFGSPPIFVRQLTESM